VRGHRELVVWQKAMTLVTDVYRVTRGFPKDELYGLTAQLRRAAVSYPATWPRVTDETPGGSFTTLSGKHAAR